MRINFNCIKRLVLAISLVLLSFPVTTIAQTTKTPVVGNGFRISPVRQPLVVEKGTSKTFTIKVTNPADSPITARPSAIDFIPSADESGEPRLILDADTVLPRNDFKRLVSPLEDLVIPAKTEKAIDITISVPNDADAGGYYGAIRFVPLLPTEEGRNVALTATIATLVLVTVPGELRQQLDLVQVSAAQSGSARGFIVGGEVSVLTRLRNTGNIHVQPWGKAEIKDIRGKVIHEFEFNPSDQNGERSNVLPDSIRKFIDNIPKDKKLLGRYTINMNLTYSEGGGDLITAKTSFWYFPVKVFYGFIILILLMAILVNWLIYKKRKRRKHSHS